MKRVFVLSIVLVLIFFVFNCKTSDDISAEQEKAEKIAGLAAKTTTVLSSNIFQTSTRFTLGGPFSSINSDIDASYNKNTGWWTIKYNYDDYSIDMELQFQDSSDNVQKYYLPSTEKIFVRGSGGSSDLSFTFDWLISGTGSNSNTISVNGTGTITYDGQTASYTIDDSTIGKNGDGSPSSGSLTINAGGITFNLYFDGNSEIIVEYTYNGKTFKIKINLKTGAVTRV